MTRFFYTDPLAAAWMYKYFGMEYKLDNPNHHPYCSDAFIGVMIYDNGKLLGCKPHKCSEKLHIHPRSLHLLEPKDGDEGIDANGAQCHRQNGEWLRAGGGHDLRHAVLTDKRNGIPFMWPESEAAKENPVEEVKS